MTPSRRSFLKKAAIFAVTTSASVPAFAQARERDPATVEEFGRQTLACADPQETFEKWIGGQFRVSQGARSFGTLVLASVQSTMFPRTQEDEEKTGRRGYAPLSTGAHVPEVRATDLEFAPRKKYLPRGIYTVDHDWLGSFFLLIEPCLYPQGTLTYVAVFTRFTGRTVTT